MKEEKVILELDPYEEGAVISALNELRNKELENQKPTDFVDDLLLKVLHAPQKKVRVRDEAR
ncbi:MAG TPA: hypothetical protein DEQ02_03780 [Ruminococcaceae bacterium]|nr:hypothetical protein [Oscillospiraceae bacterium]